MEYEYFIGLVIILYCFVIFDKRWKDKRKGILTIEEYENFIVFRVDINRYYNKPETILQIANRVRSGEKVKIDNKKVYDIILQLVDLDNDEKCNLELVYKKG
jgi:hypothetical protein